MASVGSPEFVFPIAFYIHQGNIRLAIASVGSPEVELSIAFYTHWGSIRLTNRFCGIAPTRFSYCIQTSEFLLWDRPNSNCLLCFVVSG